MLVNSIVAHLHNSIVWLVTSKAVIDFEKDMAGNQAGTVLCNPDSGKVELSPQIFRHGVAGQVDCFVGEVLQDGSQVVELLDGFGGAGTFAVDEGLAERLVAVECCLVGGETFADGRNMAGLFESSGDEAGLEVGVGMMVIVGGCGSFSEGTEPVAKVN